MSISLLPGIAALDPKSLSYAIYTQLYQHFFNAQDAGSVVEGDVTSIRLRNAAFGFAEAIASGVVGGGGTAEGGVLAGYLQRSGGQMSGPLGAEYGFTAGVENRRVLEVYSADGDGNDKGIRILGDLNVEGSHIRIGGQSFIQYDSSEKRIDVRYREINFGGSLLRLQGELLLGDSPAVGIVIAPDKIEVAGCGVYHAGNANLSSVDWDMCGANVAGDLSVKGRADFSGILTALYGAWLGKDGKKMMGMAEQMIVAHAPLSFTVEDGIRFKGSTVLASYNERDIILSSIGGDLLIGGGETQTIKILSGLADADGQYVLLSQHGAAYFPESLTVRHNFGDTLLTSYRVDSKDEGIMIHKRLRFATTEGPYISADGTGIGFNAQAVRILEDGVLESREYETGIRYAASSSLHRPADRRSDTLDITTTADFIRFDKPIEVRGHFGIDNSNTRLSDGMLTLSESCILKYAADGIRHVGKAYFQDDIGSDHFSSGFAGTGWAIVRNRTTGNMVATVDDLIVRKKMRIYELEVQQSRATNGSFWITDSCNGDTVIPIQ